MVKKITQFQADDGSLFDTEEDAAAHNAKLETAAKVDGYIKAANVQGAHANTLAKHLPQFLAYLDGDMPTPEPTKERKPRAKKAETPAGEDAKV